MFSKVEKLCKDFNFWLIDHSDKKKENTLLGVPYREHYVYFTFIGENIYVDSYIGNIGSIHKTHVDMEITCVADLVKLFSFYSLTDVAEYCVKELI